MASERSCHERAVDPAQVAHGLDEMKFAARVQEQRAVAGRQPEIEERSRMSRIGRPLLHQHRQVRGQRTHAHPGARAEQRGNLPVAVRRLADVVEQHTRDAERLLGRRGKIDEIADTCAQRGERPSGCASEPSATTGTPG